MIRIFYALFARCSVSKLDSEIRHGKSSEISIVKKQNPSTIVFWILYFTANFLKWGLFYDDFAYSFQSNLIEFPIHIGIVYFNLYVLFPRFFPTKIAKYVLILITSIAVMVLVRIVLTYQLVTTEIFKETGILGLDLFDLNYFLAAFTGESYVVGFTLAIKLGIDYVTSIKRTKDLERKTVEAELSFLRSQIQPHFFFNTLNNLYSLTLTKSDKAPETIVKLSELMSYVIYKGKSKRVPLQLEVNLIHDYLDLEKLRYGRKLEIGIDISGSLEGYYIPPLILLPFIENCFKHGDTKSDSIPIGVTIEVSEHQLTYIVKNNIQTYDLDKEMKDQRGGVGLKNTKRRLNLLFPEAYTLTMENRDGKYISTLTMPLYDQMSDS